MNSEAEQSESADGAGAGGEGSAFAFVWWQLPCYLGLDAPCVVLTWTWAVSLASGLPLKFKPAAAMFLVVWFIYLGDRLIDVFRCKDWSRATGRLQFARVFPAYFYLGLLAATGGVVALLASGFPSEVLFRGGLVAAGVALHFGLLFGLPRLVGRKLPGKEFGVGTYFSLGIVACLGFDSRQAASLVSMLVAVAVLVAVNCLVIAVADAPSDLANDPGGASRWWKTLGRDVYLLAGVLAVATVICGVVLEQLAYFFAVLLSTALLLLLHAARHRITADAVRSLADYCLFTPLLVVFWM